MKILRGLVVGAYLALSIMVCNLLQIVSFISYPFSKNACWKFNRAIANFWWGLVAWSMEHVLQIKITLTGDFIPSNENAILLPNHLSGADIPPLLWLAWKKGMTGNIKWFVKDELKWVPGIGWGLWLLGSPFLKRNWKEDRPGVVKMLATYRTNGIPIWLITFLEGTRCTPQKLAADQEKTVAKGLVPFQHHLYPKMAGIVATVQGLRDHVPAIYLIEIGYPYEQIPTIWTMLTSKTTLVDLYIRRIPIEEVPADEQEIQKWILEVWERKDWLMTFYKHHGHFPQM